MFLKSVSTYGFKSFADKTELSFGQGITAVVGPNGSGKSNVSDAIRWVLGEQSARYLRGSKMEDVIFSGSSKRRALGVAEVNLVFDNTDKQLPLDFDEVTFTRRLFRSGESDYAINKKRCRLKDITDMLADTGIGKGAMFIIGQQKIDEILNSRPEDRREIFEEAAGIARFRLRKKEASRRLSDTENNLTRINDIKCEVESQVLPAKKEAEKAEKYAEMAAQLRSCRLNSLVLDIEEADARFTDGRVAGSSVEKLILEKDSAIAAGEAEHQKLELELEELSHEAEHIQESRRKKEKEIAEVETKKGILDERVSQSGKNRTKLEARNTRIKEQMHLLQEQMGIAADELDKLEASAILAARKKTKLEAEKDAKKDAQEKGEKRIKELQDSNFEETGRMINMRNSIRSLEQEQERRLKKRNILKEKTDEQEQLLSELQAKQRKLMEKKGMLEHDISDYMKEGEALSKVNKEEKERLAAIQAEYNKSNENLNKVKSRVGVLTSMQNSLEGFGHGIKAVMKSGESWSNALIGPVATLIEVDEKYVVALETAMGRAAQNIVIETADAAKKAISYLKRTNAGRATFLPLDSVRDSFRRDTEEALVKMPGVCGFAADLISYDKKIDKAVRFLLGRILIAENMDAAVEAAKKSGYRIRVVTLGGDQVNAGGSMTGGSRSSREAGFLSREKDIEKGLKEEERLHGELLEIQERRETVERRLDFQEETLSELRENVQQRNLELTEIVSEERNLSENIQRENLALENALDEKAAVTEEYLADRKRLKEMRLPLAQMEAENVQGKEELDKLQNDIEVYKRQLSTLYMQLQDVNVQIESNNAKKAAREERMQELDGDLSAQSAEYEENLAELDNLAATVKECKERKLALDEDKKRLMQELSEFVTGQTDFSEQRIALTEKKEKSLAALNLLRQEKQKQEEKLRNMDIEQAKLEESLKNFMTQLREEFSLLSIKEAENEGIDRKKDKDALQSEERSLNRKIAALGTVNKAAVEQYNALKERYEFLNTQFNDLCQAKENLSGVIAEINTGMTKRFKNAFKEINANFKETYVKLFGGGSALVKLTDPENVLESSIEIEAQPPGKKLQSLNLLSGGERALTVIALLFAILGYKPSPFCILDEIDAPLDDVNIDRFADFMKVYSEDTQFIIITHRKGTMEAADVMYGVTMEESGVSKVLSVKMEDALAEAEK